MKRNMSEQKSPLAKVTEEAISSGNTRSLYAWLCKNSHLPGTTPNFTIARAFADTCIMHAHRGEKLAVAMATLDADAAPGASDLEFLPVCGVLAVGAYGALHAKSRRDMLDVLHDRADDLRFRVRDAVVEALAKMGAASEDALALEVATWMDGYFHAAAVLRALAHESWLPNLHDPTVVAMRFDEAFELAKRSPRAAARYPGRKALVDALGTATGSIANRFGVPIFDLLEKWTAVEDPELRETIARAAQSKAISSRYRSEIERVRDALAASAPSVRDPRSIVGPTRGRGKKRNR